MAIPLTDAQCLEALRALEEHGTRAEAARQLGVPVETLKNRIKTAARRGLHLSHGARAPEVSKPSVILPDFGDDDIPVDQIIDIQCRRFEKRKAASEERDWFPVTFTENKAVALVFFGDPHVDDNGCNWPQLRKDVELCRETEGVYGVNIGDTTNNWSGRLAQLYAKQDTSAQSARKLASWFMLDSGVSWLVWIIGNHDAWGDGAAILSEMGKRYHTKRLDMHDWLARFCLAFPNDWKPRIIAAHDFKGHSQWNPLHGPMKAGQMGSEAELFVCGHRHNWAIFNWENGDRGINQTFIRVRGYKDMDEYARRGMFPQQSYGSSIMVVFDPGKKALTAFEDLERGAEYLTMLRAA